MTKTAFLAAYEARLIDLYPWAQDAVKRERFMNSVSGTLENSVSTWNHRGEAVSLAWRAIGGKGTPTLKALRALPD